MKRIAIIPWLILSLGALIAFPGIASAADPLPSWNDGPAKKAIIEFVKETTDKASPKYVPPEARIATFDQDGTLWVEHPIYSQADVLSRSGPRTRKGEAGIGQCRTLQDSSLRRTVRR